MEQGRPRRDGKTGAAQALTGVRVLDLTRLPPGGYCTVLLADLGADVCRVVAPTTEAYPLGVGLGRGKRSVAIDLRHAGAKDLLARLVRWADVLIESERPGAMDERGFGYADADRENPALIWCSLSGFGQDGPYAGASGHDLTYVAHSGLLASIHSDLPWYPETVLAVPTSGLMAVVGILSALRERDRTGRGCQLDISIAESAMWLLSGNDGELNGAKRDIPIGPDRSLYQCSDGAWVAVACAEPRTWNALCRGLELADLVDTLHRWPEPKAIIDRLAGVFCTRPAATWVALLMPRGASVVAVNRGAALQEDPQVRERRSLQEIAGVVTPRNPIRFRDATGEKLPDRAHPPARAGADTDAVLLAAGLSSDEVSALRADGVLGPA